MIKIIFKLILLTGVFCMVSFVSFGQNVKGTVRAFGSNELLAGVNVIIKETTNGVVTDFDGNYEITANAEDVLVFSYIGFITKEATVGTNSIINMEMQEDSQQLDDVVLVGYGTQKKSQITGAISSIKNKDFKDKPNANLSSSIQGKVSGLNVTTPSGTPGAGLLVSVRGNSNPLYVVDGIPLVSESNSALSTSFDTDRNIVGKGQNISSVSDINPNDIESIEILKDASASSIYGARAANGVILITTKRGKDGKTSFNFNTYTGFQKVARKIEFLNSNQFVELIEEGRANDLNAYNQDNSIFGAGFDPSILTDSLENFNLDGTDTVWLDEVLRTAMINNYEFSTKGGSEKTKYFISGSYFNQEGIVIESFYKRYNFRLNLDHKVNDKFNIGSSISTSFSNNRRSFNDNTYTGIITNALGASPLMPVYNADGSYASFEDYQASWLSDNPVKSAKEIRAFTKSYRFLGSAFASYKITPELIFKTTLSADYNQLKDNQFLSPLTADAEAVSGEALEGNFTGTTLLTENTFNYSKTFGESDLNILLGTSLQKTSSTQSRIVGQGFPTGGIENISGAANIIGATSTGTSFSLLSYFGRLNYGFKGRYLLTGTIRADGSSRFAKDKRFGYFPSASFAWRVFQEDFFPKEGMFNDLKFRLSYGLTGDQEIGDFQNVNFYRSSNYNGQAGINLRNIADPNLTWQSNKTLNVGIDFGLFSNKLNGSFEIFKSNKTDILSEDVIPGTNGFATVTRNGGEIENKGFEFNISYNAINTVDFKWNINFNYTNVKNTIKKLNTDNVLLNAYNDLAPTHVLQVGQPVGSFWGLKYLGVDTQTGDPMYQDLDGNGEIDGDDAQIIGSALPKGFGGITNTVNWKNFDFSLFVRFSYGNEVYNLIRPTYENLGYGNDGGLSSVYANNSTNVLDRWRQPGDQAEYPRASFINANFYEGSTQFLENGSFIRIQNATLGYTFKKIEFVDDLRLYLEGQNLYLFSKYKGFDPEVSSTGGSDARTAGVDYGAYPQARTFLIGLNIGF